MKRYRIVYWMGSIITEWHGKAKDKETVIKKFREAHGHSEIINIEECE